MRKQSYRSFSQKVSRSARDKGLPLRVMFELTYRCNFKCAHCYLPPSYKERKGELNTRQVIAVIAQLKELGCLYLGFTGGEPFMRKDIMEILWYAKKNGFQVIIYTNGSLIDERVAGELAALRPNKVDITIPAMQQDTFEDISGRSGSWKAVFQAIALLHKQGVTLGFKTCLLRKNAAEIEEIQRFARSLGARHRLDEMLSPRLDGSLEPYQYRGGAISFNRHCEERSGEAISKTEIASASLLFGLAMTEKKMRHSLQSCFLAARAGPRRLLRLSAN